MSVELSLCTVVQFFKGRGDINCSCYRAMKIIKTVVEKLFFRLLTVS